MRKQEYDFYYISDDNDEEEGDAEKDDWCFDESHWIHWVMNGPNLLALSSNIFFLLRIVYILVHQLAPHPNEPSSFRRAVKAVAVLLPLLGTQYLLFIWPEPAEGVVQQIYFMLEKIVCSLHGALIALVFCYLNKEVSFIHFCFVCLNNSANHNYLDNFVNSFGIKVFN
ncbi:calcitonin gene-related peptide type 1 receptor-like [Plakobranchus ocellatus]|uniref:Calcitonin gene-related peptide type 1 receptor-like n=1 Tax=Plakobranchus ocellatus TaxID=259542 RepID=A0AAV4DL33_9GAST|nr:calcitonin gene-related peptide type 1 receptor-like [Plakobranchus ocellatus]